MLLLILRLMLMGIDTSVHDACVARKPAVGTAFGSVPILEVIKKLLLCKACDANTVWRLSAGCYTPHRYLILLRQI